MRRVAIIIINLIVILAICKNICFAKADLRLEADKYRINKDEEVTVTVKLENVSIAATTLEIYFDVEKLELVSSPENSNYSNNRILYTWVDETGNGKQNLEIGPFVFKVISNENTIASIIATGEFYNNAGEKVDIENYNLELKIGEENEVVAQIDTEPSENVEKNNTNLKILRLNHVGISPTFSKDIKEYYLILDDKINELEITAIPENSNAKVTISGNTSLKIGLNTVNIKVEAEDKTKTDNYKIYVTKTTNKDLANANLENLAVREATLSPEFDSNVTKYNIEVANNIEGIDILAIPQKENANVRIEKNEKLEIGDNKIQIIVTAEDGITNKKYEIIAHRRNEEEQVKFEEESKEQLETLNNILEEKEIEEKNNVSEDKNVKEDNVWYITIFSLLAIIVIAFGVYFMKKRK